jgi:uncharacterized oxidoreductase
MKTSGNTILITGGATGIGLALAEAFLRAGNEVIICGRRKNRLEEAKKRLSGLHVRQCNVADGASRKALVDWVTSSFTKLNVLVNNAGIQREIDLTKGTAELLKRDGEIAINFEAPIHLSALFIPHLKKQKEAAIVNVSSGLGFIPMAIMPVYCATKAGLHSFTVSLRHQLKETPIKVFELIPPMVDTELDGGARDARAQEYRGIPPSEVAAATMKGIAEDEFEIAVAQAEGLRAGSRSDFEKTFRMLNSD